MTAIKEILFYGLIVAVGMGIGTGIKYAWTWYTTPPAIIETDTSAHFATTDDKVILYTTSWCGFCTKTKEFLDSNNIKYTNYDIEANDKAINARYESIGSKGVPKILIGNKIINGFAKTALIEELKANNLM